MSNPKRKPNPVLEERYATQGSCCYYCKTKIKFESITRDHIVPKSKGGKLSNNSVFCCVSCNRAKGSMTVKEFKAKVLGVIIHILRNIVNNKFVASQSNVDKFKHNYRLFKVLCQLEFNNYKPIFGDKVTTK